MSPHAPGLYSIFGRKNTGINKNTVKRTVIIVNSRA
jgi:hypothetical protein